MSLLPVRMCQGFNQHTGKPCELVASWRVTSSSRPQIQRHTCGLHLNYFSKLVQIDEDDPVILERTARS